MKIVPKMHTLLNGMSTLTLIFACQSKIDLRSDEQSFFFPPKKKSTSIIAATGNNGISSHPAKFWEKVH